MKEHYINNKNFQIEMIVSCNMGKLTPMAQKMLIKLVNRTVDLFTYQNLELRTECISTAYEHIFTSWMHYDTEYNNPFAYFTQAVKRAIYTAYWDFYGWCYDKSYKKQRVPLLYYNALETAYF
jgi:hypothetical protein